MEKWPRQSRRPDQVSRYGRLNFQEAEQGTEIEAGLGTRRGRSVVKLPHRSGRLAVEPGAQDRRKILPGSLWHQLMTDNSGRAPRVLIIENDFLIGEMLHDMVAELGYGVTKVAHQLPSALNEISKENFDGALVNIGIDDQKHGNEIADILLAKNIPFAFVTGYGHALEQRHAGIPLLQKPFNSEQLRVLLEALVGPGGSPNHTSSHAA
jgi:CheY-like chemotaxis protein